MCVADIGLNLLFIPQFGMTGAAYATFGGEFIGSVLSFGYLICVLRKRSL
jgi:O-antigen/teichoic acid export membrane protein